MSNLTTLILLCCSVVLHAGSSLMRGPYLQVSTSSEITVRWRTDSLTVGKVLYGNSLGMYTGMQTGNATQEHEIKLTGLTPDTKYYYAILADNDTLTPVNDVSYYCFTHPIIGTKKDTRIWVIGDFGRANQGQIDTKTSYLHYNNYKKTDLWLWLGDNAYGSGTEEEFQKHLFEIYPEVQRNTVSWPCPGNHDYGSINNLTHDGPYYQLFTMPKNGEAGGVPSNEEGYFSFDYGDIHVVSLNTEWLPWVLSNSTAMANWLKQDLATSNATWKIAIFHQPPYSKGSHDSDDFFSRMQLMRQNFLPILEQYGVDLVLTGHSHAYERSYLLKGHYGNSNTFNHSMRLNSTNGKEADGNSYIKYKTGQNAGNGTVYAVMGCSGSLSSSGDLNHPANVVNIKDYYGSLIVDVSGDRMDVKMLSSDTIVRDHFTILKQDAPSALNCLGNTNLKWTLYPNPSSGELFMNYTPEKNGEVVCTVFSMEGKVVHKITMRVDRKTNTYSMPVENLSTGHYICSLNAFGKTSNQTIFIQK